ncbi:hypothetical protein M3J09_002762 [Ascochyta lentis]
MSHASRISSQRYFEEAKLAELDRRRLSVQQWLGSSPAQARHESATKLRHGTSGQWLFQDIRFQKWFDFEYCTDPVLWLNGIPGAGKTILASTIIENSCKLPQAKVCFFYCRSTDDEHHAFVRVARAMLSQLMAGNDLLMQYLYDFATRSGEAMLSSETAAQNLLDTALKSCDKDQKVYVIVDGLDECNREERKVITTWFKNQIHNVLTRDLGLLRCLFVSQDDGYARKDLSDCSSIKLTSEDTRSDIKAFCDAWQDLIAERFKPFDLKTYNISNMVATKSQGMFLYAKLVTWNLHEQPNRKCVYDELQPEMLPEGLDQAYSRVVDRIIGPTVQSRSRSRYAKQVLCWLVCAKRPLKWREIQGAVSIDLCTGTMNPDYQLQDDCKDLLASLVECSAEGSVDLVHSTAKSYLINKGYICVPAVELEMAHLCLTYLAFDHFLPQLANDQIKTALHKGDYAFADYASCFWATHLVEGICHIAHNASCNLQDLMEAIDTFIIVHWASRPDLLTVSKTLQMQLAPLNHYGEYSKICQAIVSTKNQLLSTGKGPLNDEVLHISKVMSSLRSEMELFAKAPDTTTLQRDDIHSFYGPNLFKCARLNCRFYYEGFATEHQRKQHNDKHERAFLCPEKGCPWATIGYPTAKELRAHTKECHEEPEYPEEDHEASESLTRGKQPQSFQCTLCPKRFTRAFNLRAHLRTHTEERPFVCSVCDKTWARKGDRNRHERLHSGEKKFSCRGNLINNERWGCGRRFMRADALGRHFRSEAGRVCIQPLLEEEARAKGSWDNQIGYGNEVFNPVPQDDGDVVQNQANSESLSQPFLPASLLAQYPALATMDWNSVPSAGQDGADEGSGFFEDNGWISDSYIK